MRHESLPQMWKEWHERKKGIAPARKPLRSYRELCAELGVDPIVMRGKLKRPDAPKPVLSKQKLKANNSYYDPDIFRAWWKKVKEEESK